MIQEELELIRFLPTSGTTVVKGTLFLTPQPLRAFGVFSPMVFGWAGGRLVKWAGGGKKFVQAVSPKP